jgi:hypothetical protein
MVVVLDIQAQTYVYIVPTGYIIVVCIPLLAYHMPSYLLFRIYMVKSIPFIVMVVNTMNNIIYLI